MIKSLLVLLLCSLLMLLPVAIFLWLHHRAFMSFFFPPTLQFSSNFSRFSREESLRLSSTLLQIKYGIPGLGVAVANESTVAGWELWGMEEKSVKNWNESTRHFQLAGLSKMVTAVGVLLLAQHSRIELDAPVDQYLTRWQLPHSPYNNSQVTVRRLLSHTAGINAPHFQGYPVNHHSNNYYSYLDNCDHYNCKQKENKNCNDWHDHECYCNESLVCSLNYHKVQVEKQPGTKFLYSDAGYAILELLVEDVTNTSFEQYMQHEVFEPLGMRNSSFQYNESTMGHSITSGYDLFGRKCPPVRFTEQGALGLYSTLEDMSRFLVQVFLVEDSPGMEDNAVGWRTGAPFLERRWRQEMTSPQFVISRKVQREEAVLTGGSPPFTLVETSVGLGCFIDRFSNNMSIVSHKGVLTGWQHLLAFSEPPGGRLGFVTLSNTDNGRHYTRQLYCSFVQLVLQDESVEHHLCDSMGNFAIAIVVVACLFISVVQAVILVTLVMFKKVKLSIPFLPWRQALYSNKEKCGRNSNITRCSILCSCFVRVIVIIGTCAFYIAWNIIFNSNAVLNSIESRSMIPFNFAWLTLITGLFSFFWLCVALFVYRARDGYIEEQDEEEQAILNKSITPE